MTDALQCRCGEPITDHAPMRSGNVLWCCHRCGRIAIQSDVEGGIVWWVMEGVNLTGRRRGDPPMPPA